MKSWSKKNSDPTRRVGSVTVVNVSRPFALKYITFPSTGAKVRPLPNSQKKLRISASRAVTAQGGRLTDVTVYQRVQVRRPIITRAGVTAEYRATGKLHL